MFDGIPTDMEMILAVEDVVEDIQKHELDGLVAIGFRDGEAFRWSSPIKDRYAVVGHLTDLINWLLSDEDEEEVGC